MILKINETAKDSVLFVNSQTANYPVVNILDSRLSKLFKTDSVTTAEIVFNAGSAIDVSSIDIANHNITSGATITLEGNTSNSWGSPAFTKALTWDADVINADFDLETYQDWRVVVVDGSNPDGLISIGRVSLTDSYTTAGISPRVSDTRDSKSKKSKTIAGQSYLDRRYINTMISVRFPKLTHTQKAELIEQFEISDIGIPFFVTFNETCTDLTTIYVTFDQTSLAFNLLSNISYYESSFSLEEEV